ncbi:hypothetical protein K3495_g2606 [Podosphaera aphanis]|nr:hypothetical protein K3495_g2606 [Podosphaera aphanis]
MDEHLAIAGQLETATEERTADCKDVTEYAICRQFERREANADADEDPCTPYQDGFASQVILLNSDSANASSIVVCRRGARLSSHELSPYRRPRAICVVDRSIFRRRLGCARLARTEVHAHPSGRSGGHFVAQSVPAEPGAAGVGPSASVGSRLLADVGQKSRRGSVAVHQTMHPPALDAHVRAACFASRETACRERKVVRASKGHRVSIIERGSGRGDFSSLYTVVV